MIRPQFTITNNFGHLNPETGKSERPARNHYQIRGLTCGLSTKVYNNGRTRPYKGEEPIDEIYERDGVYIPVEGTPTFDNLSEAEEVRDKLLSDDYGNDE